MDSIWVDMTHVVIVIWSVIKFYNKTLTMASDSEESLGVPLSETLTLNWKEGCAS